MLSRQSILGALRDSRDVLSGIFKKEMKVLGQWGFDVMDVRENASRARAAEAKVKV